MSKDHRINIRVDRATYEDLLNYADKNTFRDLSEGVRRLLKQALNTKSRSISSEG